MRPIKYRVWDNLNKLMREAYIEYIDGAVRFTGGQGMRPIKFRAWDKEYYEMCYKIDAISFRDGACFVTFNRKKIEATDDLKVPDRAILLEYTGLLDKNGKEVYEGDIIIGWDSGLTTKAVLKFGTGTYDSGHYRFTGFYFDDIEEDFAKNSWNIELMEVVGNIYENPELLKNE